MQNHNHLNSISVNFAKAHGCQKQGSKAKQLLFCWKERALPVLVESAFRQKNCLFSNSHPRGKKTLARLLMLVLPSSHVLTTHRGSMCNISTAVLFTIFLQSVIFSGEQLRSMALFPSDEKDFVSFRNSLNRQTL